MSSIPLRGTGGNATHGTRLAFERDRERDRKLHVGGWRPIRVTWWQLDREADAVTADIEALLG